MGGGRYSRCDGDSLCGRSSFSWSAPLRRRTQWGVVVFCGRASGRLAGTIGADLPLGPDSHVRPVDVLGTVAFAQLPFVLLSLFMALPPMREVATIQSVQAVDALLTDTPRLLVLVWIGVVSLLLSIWVLYWLFRATSVACNLKGRNLWIVFIIGAFGGDVLCRYLIGLCY